MTEEQANDEMLEVAIIQLRRAWNLLRMGAEDDIREADKLILAASNGLTTALWMRRGGRP
jgi:hypothetical protein